VISKVTNGHQGVQGCRFKQALGSKRQGIKRRLACYKKILKKKKVFSSHASVLYYFQPPSWTHASPPVLLDNPDDDSDDLPTVAMELSFSTFCKIFICNA
jgi:radical SAM superfamily enzyme